MRSLCFKLLLCKRAISCVYIRKNLSAEGGVEIEYLYYIYS